MDTSHKVVEALSLAINRLDEPPVLEAYRRLIEIVDTHLGAQTFGGGNLRALTEPQLVLISYGLKHLKAANSGPLIRATDRLLAVLAGEPDVDFAADADAQDAEKETDAEVSWQMDVDQLPDEQPAAAAVQPQPSPVTTHVEQHIERISGGNVTMIGVQNTHHAAPPATTYDDGDADADDTSEMAAAHTGKTREIPNDVFISYSRRNAEIMRRIRADLRSGGMNVWTDENLQPGTPSWRRAVEAAIRGARSMVIIMTPDSKESEWVERELNAARENGVPIFPILARGSNKNAVPLQLNSYQYVDIRKEEDYRTSILKLTKAVRAEIKRTKR
ncbi:MAG: toll/interleukin-1 receptor domain-containing protein [Anaerolineae bacterium]|nr:toll/interleukin-1 receptor domain-containing protein [Anaerolineae bacterium]MCA9911631.1 toll/interleukin-1 receptor domain-containing protein [Anaerolineae bacterium]